MNYKNILIILITCLPYCATGMDSEKENIAYSTLVKQRKADIRLLHSILQEKRDISTENKGFQSHLKRYPNHTFEQYCTYRDQAETYLINQLKMIDRSIDDLIDGLENLQLSTKPISCISSELE